MDFKKEDVELIMEGARLCGITFSAYMRMAGIQKARQLIKEQSQ